MNWLVLNKSSKTPEIHINGFIGQYSKVNYGDFKTALQQLKDDGVTKCKVYVNSGGGDMIEGLALYDAAAECEIEFDVQVIGMAASMGSLLMYIGVEKPDISKNARVMFHKPQAGAYGEADTLRNRADLCDSLETQIKAILVTNTGQSKEVVDSWFVAGKEKWFTAKEAVALGICKAVVKSADDDKEIEVEDSLSEEELYSKVYNQITNIKTQKMKYPEAVKLTLGLPSNSTDEQVDAHLAKLKADAEKAKGLEAEIQNQAKTRAKALVDNAIAQKKVTESDRAELEAQAEANYAFVENMLNKITAPNLPAGQTKVEGASKQDAGREKWTLGEWAKNDIAGLEKMKHDNKEQYLALCKAAGVSVLY